MFNCSVLRHPTPVLQLITIVETLVSSLILDSGFYRRLDTWVLMDLLDFVFAAYSLELLVELSPPDHPFHLPPIYTFLVMTSSNARNLTVTQP